MPAKSKSNVTLGEGSYPPNKKLDEVSEKVGLTIEAVKWIDSVEITTGWMEIKRIKMDVSLECWSVGFLLHEDSEKIILVESVGLDRKGQKPETADFGLAIPKVSILKRIILHK